MGEVTYWRRPDKTKGVSATTGYGGTNLLYIFTSSAPPFEPDTAYSPFGAYALLEHDGDFQRAAKVLHNRGYGTQYEHGRRVTRVNTTRPATRQRVVGKRR